MDRVINRIRRYMYGSRLDVIWPDYFIRNVIMHIIMNQHPPKAMQKEFLMLVRFVVYITRNEANWLAVTNRLMQVTPAGTISLSTLVVLIRSLPHPLVSTVNKLLSELYSLHQQRAVSPDLDIPIEKNICLLLNLLAEKLEGVQTSDIFTTDVCEYLYHIFMNSKPHNDLELQLRALLALEKFAVTRQNKEQIIEILGDQNSNLSHLETLTGETTMDNTHQREVGFCARWALDNMFPIPGRQLSYEKVNTSNINCILKNDTANIFLKYSPDLMEIRNDTIWPQTLHGTCKVDEGAWYYEVTLLTSGSVVVGWGSTGADTVNMNFLID